MMTDLSFLGELSL